MKPTIIILNSKQRKEIRQMLEKQYGITTLPDKVFFCLNKKERVYIANRDLFDIDHAALRVNAFGLYFGTFMKDGFRLSLEGAQMLIDQCSMNTFDLSVAQRDEWFSGSDVELNPQTEVSDQNAGSHANVDLKSELVKEDISGYKILLYEDDVIGVGKIKNGVIMNYLPKSRRLSNIFSDRT
ncbi:MAG: methyltransferase RsmF C-terminal domain-like protein [Nanobdellota archaeon]